MKYTIEEIQNRTSRLWIKCTSIAQGRKLGNYYYKNQKGQAWQDFGFNGLKTFYIYIAHTGNTVGGWSDGTIARNGTIIDFEDVIFPKPTYYLTKKEMPSLPVGSKLVFKDEKWDSNPSASDGYWFTQQEIDENPEWFESVYEETFKVGDWVVTTQKGDTGIEIGTVAQITCIDHAPEDEKRGSEFNLSCGYWFNKPWIRKATEEEIEKAKGVTIGGYQAEIRGGLVRFGCQSFSKDELQAISKLFNKEINATITIRGEVINEFTIDKLLSL